MKRRIVGLSLLLFCISCIISPIVAAHSAGEDAYFFINDKAAEVYPVESSSSPDISLPHDLAPEEYLVFQPLTFKLEKDALPLPTKDLASTYFRWDFGDGMTADGHQAVHSYQKMGSYILTVKAVTTTPAGKEKEQQIEAIMLHILPHRSYQLPKAVITINGEITSSGDIVTLDDKTATFDATETSKGTAPLQSYIWDLGNGASETQRLVNYEYPDASKRYLFPLLRVVDANGFISDAYVQLDLGATRTATAAPVVPLIAGGIFSLVILGSLVLIIRRTRSAHSD